MREYISESLREKIIASYVGENNQRVCEANSISMDSFISGVKKWLAICNTPYDQRPENNGVWYASDYCSRHTPGNTFGDLLGLAPNSHWTLGDNKHLFRAAPGVEPSEALNAFFHGPTFPDCGSVLQACIFKSIEEMLGTQKFNSLFAQSVAPFIITHSLYSPLHHGIDINDKGLDDLTRQGNPLHSLFDEGSISSGIVSEQDIEVGDILFIRGVEQYNIKHMFGFGCGFNLICVGADEQGKNLYSGFGPQEFEKPLTYSQIKSMLIDLYNAPQSLDTKMRVSELVASADHAKAILQFLENELVKNPQSATEPAMIQLGAFSLSKLTENDVLSHDTPIIGIECSIKFNIEKLKEFASIQERNHDALPTIPTI